MSTQGSEAKRKAGKLGGLTTAGRYGVGYMAELGRRGAAVTWRRYCLVPAGVGGYAMVERSTGKVKAVR